MSITYQPRWISRERAGFLKRKGQLGQAMVLDTFNGIILVEPVGSNMGDGPILSHVEANYELQPVWFLGPKPRLQEARRRLGLEAETAEDALVTSEV